MRYGHFLKVSPKLFVVLLPSAVDAEAMRQRLVVKESLTQAFKELREAEASGAELPDARNLFK